jgi:hypothetical protein
MDLPSNDSASLEVVPLTSLGVIESSDDGNAVAANAQDMDAWSEASEEVPPALVGSGRNTPRLQLSHVATPQRPADRAGQRSPRSFIQQAAASASPAVDFGSLDAALSLVVDNKIANEMRAGLAAKPAKEKRPRATKSSRSFDSCAHWTRSAQHVLGGLRGACGDFGRPVRMFSACTNSDSEEMALEVPATVEKTIPFQSPKGSPIGLRVPNSSNKHLKRN